MLRGKKGVVVMDEALAVTEDWGDLYLEEGLREAVVPEEVPKAGEVYSLRGSHWLAGRAHRRAIKLERQKDRSDWLTNMPEWETIARQAINHKLQGCNMYRGAFKVHTDPAGTIIFVLVRVQLHPRKEMRGGYRIPMGKVPRLYTLYPIWDHQGDLRDFKVVKGWTQQRSRPKLSDVTVDMMSDFEEDTTVFDTQSPSEPFEPVGDVHASIRSCARLNRAAFVYFSRLGISMDNPR